ncbi:MAG TPA: IclR family transcriptional regulator, partial [Victivallales bacterium]|nr:IclR family transcriptional regulator [Victivallales bacterium]
MNNTLQNGFKILEYLASTAEAYSVKELAEYFKIPNSHACRLLKTLVQTGYVEQEKKGGKYKISLRILTLSNACLSRLVIRNRLRPFLIRLCGLSALPVYLIVPFERRPLIIDVVYPEKARGDYGLTIGALNPVHASAGGKLCAAYIPEEELDSFLENIEFIKYTEKTITNKEFFKSELKKIREEMIAITDSERFPGTYAIAAPVFDFRGNFVSAIGLASMD